MKINVLFFAQLRDRFNQSERFVELEQGSTVETLAELLFGDGREIPIFLRYAVNETFAEANTTLKDGDTVALMTPVSGG